MLAIDLAGKTALVTGGGQGLGAEICRLLTKAGANVGVNYFNEGGGVNRELAEEMVKELGGGAIAVEGDVRDASAVKEIFDKVIGRFGAVDILVNNAAILRDRTVKKMADDEWQAVIDTNLTGVFNCCRQAAQRLSDGGRIVSFSSIAAAMGFFGQCNYASAKAGVVGMTKVLSKELAKREITVNAVAPGVVLTEMGKSIPEAVRGEMLKAIPLGRFGEPSEVAGVVVFLCSDLASYVTGQVVHINGGWFG